MLYPPLQFIHNLLDMEFASGGRPGSVVVAGHSQGAALALYASVTYSRRSWDGVASFLCTERLKLGQIDRFSITTIDPKHCKL